jgi:hypothetical protein
MSASAKLGENSSPVNNFIATPEPTLMYFGTFVDLVDIINYVILGFDQFRGFH